MRRIKMAVSKCPCLTLSRVNVMLDAKISLVPTHQLIVPSTLLAPATDIRTYKATKIHTFKPLTSELGAIIIIIIIIVVVTAIVIVVIFFIIIIVVAESLKRSGSVEKDKVGEIPAN